ncbi:mitochondrial carrier domain-containing protein [Hygrophoropsis aurantiaca]|uniref:Mitochondrial carrier domain-containing protein n=1 Tax=Hygrophoropsis aurantiaca TaxID=72124 RepID=A0ACB8A033_9AGAM|nr:mitochondrial carrier domain-containing protein [Hygrophoropsis aurantiaca]
MSTSTRDKRSLDYALRSGIAGGVAGCVAKTVVAPLDRVKILFQASNPDFQKYAGSWSGAYKAGRAIYRDGGVRGLLQGHSATLLRIFPYAGIKFMAYDQWRALLMPDSAHETNVRRFTAGALAGLTSVTFTYPLELIRVRMAFQSRTHTRPTFLSAMMNIYHENARTGHRPPRQYTPSPARTLFQRFPVLKFYRGFTVTMVGMVPYAGTAFLTWDFLRAHFYPSTHDRTTPSAAANLLIGALSGALAQTASYPFEVVRRRMQVGGLTSPGRWLGWGEVVRAIWRGGPGGGASGSGMGGTGGMNANGPALRVGGWRGFYVGLGIGYLKIVPMTAVSFMVWQWAKGVLDV